MIPRSQEESKALLKISKREHDSRLIQKFAENKDFMLAAIAENSQVLAVSKKLQRDRDFMLEAISRNGLALEYASEELKGSRVFMLEVERLSSSSVLGR